MAGHNLATYLNDHLAGSVVALEMPEAIAEMARIAGLEVPVFVERYWKHRLAYDRGCDARMYWSTVAGPDLTDGMLRELTRLDVAGWSHLNEATLEVLAANHDDGASLSLLSNAPRDLARVLTDHPALRNFDHLLFSSQLGVAKPDPAAFEAAVERLSRPREQIVFIDDRPENVEAARRVGLRAVQFTSAARLRTELCELRAELAG